MTIDQIAWRTIQRGGHEVTLVFQELVEETEYGARYEETEETVTAVQDETQVGMLQRTQRETSPDSTRVYYVATTDDVDTPLPIEDGGGDSATELHDTDAVWIVTDYDDLNNGVYRMITRRSS